MRLSTNIHTLTEDLTPLSSLLAGLDCYIMTLLLVPSGGSSRMNRHTLHRCAGLLWSLFSVVSVAQGFLLDLDTLHVYR